MDMTCRNCGKEVYQTGVNFRDKITDEIHYNGVEKVYKCIGKINSPLTNLQR